MFQSQQHTKTLVLWKSDRTKVAETNAGVMNIHLSPRATPTYTKLEFHISSVSLHYIVTTIFTSGQIKFKDDIIEVDIPIASKTHTRYWNKRNDIPVPT
jgi:hypothetical protein